MLHIVGHDVFETRCFVRPFDNADFRKVVARSRTPPSLLRGCLHDTRELKIECSPECHEVLPRRLGIAPDSDPVFLRIPRKNKIVLQLSANESLMIVRRRIDQVADDLLVTTYPAPALPRFDPLEQASAA